MQHSTGIRKDTYAWKLQVWASFGIAAALCGWGLVHLPGDDVARAFMALGTILCLSTAFALAKYMRDNKMLESDAPTWRLVVWGRFLLAMSVTGWGLWGMDIDPTYKAFLTVSWLFLLSSSFTLAKTSRDAFEVAAEEARRRSLRNTA